MTKAIIPKTPNYLGKRFAIEHDAKSLDELMKRVKQVREKAHRLVDDETTSTSISFCYYCKRAVVNNEYNVYRTKRRNPPECVLACNRCRVSGTRRAFYRKKHGLP